MKRQLIAFAVLAFLSTPLKADLVCPTGSLADLIPSTVWARYSKASADYIKSLHLRLSRDLKAVLDARTTAGRARAAAALGEDHAIVMQRMFEEGFIAATDIINAYCVTRPIGEVWNDQIKHHRELIWCEQWGTAHFC